MKAKIPAYDEASDARPAAWRERAPAGFYVAGVARHETKRSAGRRSWWLRAPLAALFVGTGTLHLIDPEPFVAIVPEVLPSPRALVYASGVAELLGGLGLLDRRTARPAGWWLIATLVAVFPANVGMALAPERHPNIPEALLWARLPLQAVLIAWVHRVAIAHGGEGSQRTGAASR